ncbi:MAG: hypothetical protein ACHBN1_16270 [Heteroscytonema crispum UTEX LB 1556]
MRTTGVGVGRRVWGDGCGGQARLGRNLKIPMPNAQCPMPNAQCPMPNAQCPMPNAQGTRLPLLSRSRRALAQQCPMPNMSKIQEGEQLK